MSQNTSLLVLIGLLSIAPLVNAFSRSQSSAQSKSDLPVVTKAVAPSSYPKIAIQAHATGIKIIVEVCIDPSGTVTSTRILDGHALFHASALSAAKQWRFNSDQSASRTAHLVFNFAVSDGDSAEISFLPPYEVNYTVPYPKVVQMVNN